jgi:hypothetical protein
MALQAATLSRASSSARTLAAAVKGDKKARVAMIEAEEMCIFLGSSLRSDSTIRRTLSLSLFYTIQFDRSAWSAR